MLFAIWTSAVPAHGSSTKCAADSRKEDAMLQVIRKLGEMVENGCTIIHYLLEDRRVLEVVTSRKG